MDVTIICAQTQTNLRPDHLVSELNYLCINIIEVRSPTVSLLLAPWVGYNRQSIPDLSCSCGNTKKTAGQIEIDYDNIYLSVWPCLALISVIQDP